jgi:DNA-binding MarR family transcriptional regulator
MDQTDLRTLRLLEALGQEPAQSQRDLAQRLDISLGLTNSFIKRLVHKGYFKITTIPRNRVKYILTPAGALEKARLTCEYIQFSYRYYKEARQKLRELFGRLERQGVKRLAFYGATDLAEIAFLSLQETSIELVAVVDDGSCQQKFMGQPIGHPAKLAHVPADRVLITAVDNHARIVERLRDLHIPENHIDFMP